VGSESVTRPSRPDLGDMTNINNYQACRKLPGPHT
jgi:hypothetical protein